MKLAAFSTEIGLWRQNGGLSFQSRSTRNFVICAAPHLRPGRQASRRSAGAFGEPPRSETGRLAADGKWKFWTSYWLQRGRLEVGFIDAGRVGRGISVQQIEMATWSRRDVVQEFCKEWECVNVQEGLHPGAVCKR
jgi:hypothetical protein